MKRNETNNRILCSHSSELNLWKLSIDYNFGSVFLLFLKKFIIWNFQLFNIICIFNLICVLCTFFVFFFKIPFVSSNNHFYFTSVLFTLSQTTHIYMDTIEKTETTNREILLQYWYKCHTARNKTIRIFVCRTRIQHQNTQTHRHREIIIHEFDEGTKKRKIKHWKFDGSEKHPPRQNAIGQTVMDRT